MAAVIFVKASEVQSSGFHHVPVWYRRRLTVSRHRSEAGIFVIIPAFQACALPSPAV